MVVKRQSYTQCVYSCAERADFPIKCWCLVYTWDVSIFNWQYIWQSYSITKYKVTITISYINKSIWYIGYVFWHIISKRINTNCQQSIASYTIDILHMLSIQSLAFVLQQIKNAPYLESVSSLGTNKLLSTNRMPCDVANDPAKNVAAFCNQSG